MKCTVYSHEETLNIALEKAEVESYLNQNQLITTQSIHDTDNIKNHWTERAIGNVIKQANNGDILVAYDAAALACSTSQVLEIFNMAADRGLHIYFAKYQQNLINETNVVNTRELVRLISAIESDFISRRTTQALARRRAAGLPLGRPKGRGNKSLKLDKHREDIKKYLSLGISKASIAKLVDCHPQTLYDWLERNEEVMEGD